MIVSLRGRRRLPLSGRPVLADGIVPGQRVNADLHGYDTLCAQVGGHSRGSELDAQSGIAPGQVVSGGSREFRRVSYDSIHLRMNRSLVRFQLAARQRTSHQTQQSGGSGFLCVQSVSRLRCRRRLTMLGEPAFGESRHARCAEMPLGRMVRSPMTSKIYILLLCVLAICAWGSLAEIVKAVLRRESISGLLWPVLGVSLLIAVGVWLYHRARGTPRDHELHRQHPSRSCAAVRLCRRARSAEHLRSRS